MYNPISTYRIQFNKAFTFKDLENRIDFLSFSNIRTIYASPIFTAIPGSSHGYNITDPTTINQEIGTKEEFVHLIECLKSKNIGWIQDIVPNHMAFHKDNHWIMDVLEKGEKSPFATYFDINFDNPEFQGKVMIPFLNKSLEKSLEEGDLKLTLRNQTLYFEYFDNLFPINKESIEYIINNKVNCPFTEYSINKLNEEIDFLKNIINQQHYFLSYWQEADIKLNYRRFFTINDLIGLQIDNPNVFKEFHHLIADLMHDGLISGLRLDCVDALKDTSSYIDDLRILVGDEKYIVVEKILAKSESLEISWPIQGTTGYDFLGLVNNLFTYKKKYPILQKYYREISEITISPLLISYEKRKMILSKYMAGDWDNLFHLYIEGGFMDDNNPGITIESMKEAIGEFILAFDRNKIYSNNFPISGDDKEILERIIDTAANTCSWLSESLSTLKIVVLNQTGFDEYKKNAALQFLLQCMQVTTTVIAKGLEDTMMYDYNCFIAHNEIGDSINANGITIQDFHDNMISRQEKTPLTLNTTSTHDTKRGEDVRARLNVLSEIPEKWISETDLWFSINKKIKKLIDGMRVPDVNEEYMIYQIIIGIYPFEGTHDEIFLTRIDNYLIKALREAKIHSNWNKPNILYEQAVIDFTRSLFESESAFLQSFIPFCQIVSKHGIINSLSQVVLKSTCPGIPDFYQGSELWDLSLVDPDNRQPIDYQVRDKILQNLIANHTADPENFIQNLHLNLNNGELKFWITHLMLKLRSDNPDFFIKANYIPLVVTGKYKDYILAFARSFQNHWWVTVIPLYPSLLNYKPKNSNSPDWDNTKIHFSEFSPEKWTGLISGEYDLNDGCLKVSDIMNVLCPVVLQGKKSENKRDSGILIHISSLPGKYGIGDVGPSAIDFIKYLNDTGQRYWQILPLNPTESGSDNSPYSTYSAFAGNLKFISPDNLVKHKLLDAENLLNFKFQESNRVDFKKAEEFRHNILNVVYSRFKTNTPHYLKNKYLEFCEKEQYWLNDYALYLLLKQEFKGKPWYQWPKGIRERYPESLEKYQKKYHDPLEKEKFFQFIFSQQWHSLREYANNHGINIIGDLPFYVTHDSVDVWQNPQFFKLTEDKQMQFVAGVPPDYFSTTGQLWNMPVYNWSALQDDNFKWWRQRIHKNLEYCNSLRLDHFRGFSSFWEVPHTEKTAENGQWIDAPGMEFFELLLLDFPSMPFIAEDLGDINEEVIKLRDHFNLPGMSVLQFAFGSDHSSSIHAPHNFTGKSIVYTGTHDNNTTRGWFKNEVDKSFQKILNDYTNKIIHYSTIHEDFIRMAYNSVANTAIIPIQDILGLDQSARLNNPSYPKGNWLWKLKTRDLKGHEFENIKRWMELYGRL